MWDLPRPGLEPVSPASAGRFSTTAPPGKPPRIKYVFLILVSGCEDRGLCHGHLLLFALHLFLLDGTSDVLLGNHTSLLLSPYSLSEADLKSWLYGGHITKICSEISSDHAEP